MGPLTIRVAGYTWPTGTFEEDISSINLPYEFDRDDDRISIDMDQLRAVGADTTGIGTRCTSFWRLMHIFSRPGKPVVVC